MYRVPESNPEITTSKDRRFFFKQLTLLIFSVSKGVSKQIETKGTEQKKDLKTIVEKHIKGPKAKKQAIEGILNFLNLDNEYKEALKQLNSIFKNIDWKIIGGVGIKESVFNPNSISNKNAQGIFQIIPGTYNGLVKYLHSENKYKGKEEKYFSNLSKIDNFMKIFKKYPKDAIAIAYLDYLFKKYEKKTEGQIKALGVYNSGKDNFKDWPKETINYILGDASVFNYGKVFTEFLQHLKT